MIEGLPLPDTCDPLDRVFWDNALVGRLMLQACGGCGTVRFPPRPMCPHCQSESVTWQVDSGDATIWSFAVPSAPLLPAFEAMTPYVTVIAELTSNPAIRIAGMAVRGDDDPMGLTAADVVVGQGVTACFRTVASACSLVFWRLDPADRPKLCDLEKAP